MLIRIQALGTVDVPSLTASTPELQATYLPLPLVRSQCLSMTGHRRQCGAPMTMARPRFCIPQADRSCLGWELLIYKMASFPC